MSVYTKVAMFPGYGKAPVTATFMSVNGGIAWNSVLRTATLIDVWAISVISLRQANYTHIVPLMSVRFLLNVISPISFMYMRQVDLT